MLADIDRNVLADGLPSPEQGSICTRDALKSGSAVLISRTAVEYPAEVTSFA